MKKRLTNILLALALLSVAVCVFASCGKKHTHSFGEWTVVKQATCETDGVKTRKCSGCDRTEEEAIAATGHTYGEWIPEVPATADENGVKAHKDCTVCGLHFDADGNKLDSLVIPASGHSFGAWVEEVHATCDADGVKGHYTCSHCSKYFDENYNVIEDLTIHAVHKLKFYARIEPTCERVGRIAIYVCENCSTMFDENKAEIDEDDISIAALGHLFGEWEEEIPATCEKNGVKAHKSCTRCKKNFDKNGNETDVILFADHNLTMVAEISATCTESGRRAYGQCSECKKYFDVFGAEVTDFDSLVIPAKNHAFGSWISAIEPSCTDQGLTGHYHCRNCNKDYDKNGAEIAEVYISALGHLHTTEEIIPGKNATCLEDGFVAHYECERCGAKTDALDRIIEAGIIVRNGHTAGKYVNIVYPSCTETGVDGYYICSVCGDRFDPDDYFTTVTDEDLVLQPTGHKYMHFDREEPECELEGRKEHYMCENSGCYMLLDAEKNPIGYNDLYIRPTGHDLGDWVEELEATETEDGYIGHYQCKKCLYYFDEDRYQIGGTIVIPKTVHLFDTYWVSEVRATCDTDGTQGYYLCSHCNKKFDLNYKEIDDLTIPAHHNVGKLTPAKQAKCLDDDILVSYYYCNDCRKYLDENMNVLSYNDIFRQANRHGEYIYVRPSDWYHIKECRDCGYLESEQHKYEFSYITENNVPVQKGVCKYCGYERTDTYNVVSKVYVKTDFYVGFHNSGMMPFIIKYRDGNEVGTHASAVMSEADARRFNEIVDSSAQGFDTRTEKFTLTYLNFTSEVELTFHPFIVYGVVTDEKVYRKGSVSSLKDIDYVYDCNYTRDTGVVVKLYGDITDNGGFDPDFDFGASGLSEKTFNVKFKYLNIEYDVSVTLTDVKKPAYIEYYDDYFTILGDSLSLEIVYSDGSRKYVTVTEEMIVRGTFDPNVLGKQTVTVEIEGLVRTITVNVRDPYEISYMYLENDTIELGEKLKLFVVYLQAGSDTIEVTPDMIEGTFDNSATGTYDITIVYDGMVWTGEIKVIDPDDSRAESIEPFFSGSLIWDVKDGKVVENIDYLYLNVHRNNDTHEYVKVTRDMISYDAAEAEQAVANSGVFKLTISYYGKTCIIYVTPQEIDSSEVYHITSYDINNLNSGVNSNIYMKDGDLSDYFIYVSANRGYFCLPVTKDMFYAAGRGSGEDSLVAFDVDGAESGQDYRVKLKYRDQGTNFFNLVKYTESDVEYFFNSYNSVSVVVGTREQVLERLADARFLINKNICGYTLSIGEFYFADLVLAPNEDVDFGTPGYIELVASYKGFVGEFSVCLIPDVEGVEYTTYKISRAETLRLYKNGYACLNDIQWGTYVCVNEELNLYRVDLYDWYDYTLYMLNGDIATRFTAEMIEENPEIYSAYTEEGLCTVKVYTKNGFSLADIYDEDDYLQKTVIITFSADGKFVYVGGTKYAIGEDNMLTIVVESNVVYRFYEDTDEESYISGTFNDNGLCYMAMGQIYADGSKTEYVFVVYTWEEKDGIVTLYNLNGQLATRGKIAGGYFYPDYE